ncbi:RNA-directed DNA polymerase, eukaryota, reverse transcriptase zinc-binding domain protein [Tanacetum coccineum]
MPPCNVENAFHNDLGVRMKAFDSFGFGNKWCSWIKACLNSSRASILINGSPTSEFSIKRGLRQGDPLSYFLFILVMEGLHNAFEEAVGNGLITGVILRILLSMFPIFSMQMM